MYLNTCTEEEKKEEKTSIHMKRFMIYAILDTGYMFLKRTNNFWLK